MKCIYALILTLTTLLVPAYERQEEIVAEEPGLVGVWRTEGFNPHGWEPHAALYIQEIWRDDGVGSMTLHIILPSTGVPTTSSWIFNYEIVNSQVIVSTPLPFVDILEFELMNDGNILFNTQRISGNLVFDYFFELYHFSEELPFGWSLEDVWEMSRTNQKLRTQKIAFVEQFLQGIGVPGELWVRDLFEGSTASELRIGDITIEIQYIGETPVPLTRQWHMRIPGQGQPHMTFTGPPPLWSGQTVYVPQVAKSANGQFALRHYGDMPQEWIEIFRGLDDLFEW